jgi:hypothetical protein
MFIRVDISNMALADVSLCVCVCVCIQIDP